MTENMKQEHIKHALIRYGTDATLLVRVEAKDPDTGEFIVWRVRADGTPATKHARRVWPRELIATFAGLPTKAERRAAAKKWRQEKNRKQREKGEPGPEALRRYFPI